MRSGVSSFAPTRALLDNARMRHALAALLLTTAFASAARAADCPAAHLVTYYKPTTLPTTLDTRCKIVKGKCTKLEMMGYLYAPSATGVHKSPHPIIVYNHGSGPNPPPSCDEGTYFSSLGYLVFVPIRRGVGVSTGVDPQTFNQEYCADRPDAGKCKMDYLHDQMEDVQKGIEFARAQPDVDPKALILMGHSFGGIVTTMANTHDYGQRAIVDFAGSSQSWDGNQDAVDAMTKDVQNAVAPIFFVEPQNDHSIWPTVQLAWTAGKACKEYESMIYAPIDINDDGKVDKTDFDPVDNRDKAHVKSMKEPAVWGPSVEAFMNRYLTTPARPFDKMCHCTSLTLDSCK